MFEVVKRDGQVTEFNLGKINDAIAKAFDATQMSYNDDIIVYCLCAYLRIFRIRSRTERYR